jgi:hypothetical protein
MAGVSGNSGVCRKRRFLSVRSNRLLPAYNAGKLFDPNFARA